MIEMVRVYSPSRQFIGKKFFILVEKFSHVYQEMMYARFMEVKNPGDGTIIAETYEFL